MKAFRAFLGCRYDNVKVPYISLDQTDQAVLQNGPLSTVNFRVTHNTRDFDLEPASGGYEIYTGDIGHANLRPLFDPNGNPTSGVFGNLNYTRAGIDARRYFIPQGPRNTPKDQPRLASLKLDGGHTTRTLPFVEQVLRGGREITASLRRRPILGKQHVSRSRGIPPSPGPELNRRAVRRCRGRLGWPL